MLARAYSLVLILTKGMSHRRVPSNVSLLLQPPVPPPKGGQIRQRKLPVAGDYIPLDSETRESVLAFEVAAYETGFRYTEYCITAPLLFLAVLSLLTVDAPAWLYFTGYWMIQACIASGIAFHATFCADLYSDAEGLLTGTGTTTPQSSETVADWFRSLLSNGSW